MVAHTLVTVQSQAGNLYSSVHCTIFPYFLSVPVFYHLENRIAAILLFSENGIDIKVSRHEEVSL